MLVYRRPDLREQIVQNFGPTYSTADEFVNIFMVVELCLVIPVQTAYVERGNGCLNRIMTDHRSTQQVVLWCTMPLMDQAIQNMMQQEQLHVG